ncbi:hypothetical protein DL93DRAFT_2100934 [Clavulina sp. PMI_390]|nr:hypothetical protein DL93DRAFT_2100934 [Clavulina sp. PMI_390]
MLQMLQSCLKLLCSCGSWASTTCSSWASWRRSRRRFLVEFGESILPVLSWWARMASSLSPGDTPHAHQLQLEAMENAMELEMEMEMERKQVKEDQMEWKVEVEECKECGLVELGDHLLSPQHSWSWLSKWRLHSHWIQWVSRQRLIRWSILELHRSSRHLSLHKANIMRHPGLIGDRIPDLVLSWTANEDKIQALDLGWNDERLSLAT